MEKREEGGDLAVSLTLLAHEALEYTEGKKGEKKERVAAMSTT